MRTGGRTADRNVGEKAVTSYMDMLGAEQSADLAQRIRRGDRTAEARLVSLYCDCVFSMALTRTHDHDAARELMDDILMAVVMALRHGNVRDCNHLGGFVHGTAVNKINSYFRRRRHQPRTVRLDPDMPAQDPRNDYDAQDRQKMARDAMALLDERDRTILFLSLNEGLKPGEIAAKLRMSPTLVRQRKCRALRAIVMFVSDGSPSYKARRLLRR